MNPSTNNQNSASGLIVDFPSSLTRMKSVRFAKLSQVRFFQRPSSQDNEKKSYNRGDYKRFTQARNQDVLECSDMFMGTRVNLSLEDRWWDSTSIGSDSLLIVFTVTLTLFCLSIHHQRLYWLGVYACTWRAPTHEEDTSGKGASRQTNFGGARASEDHAWV